MLKITTTGLPKHLTNGLCAYTQKYCKSFDGELTVNIKYNKDDKRLVICRNGSQADITVSEDVQIFRALSKLLMNFENKSFNLSETSFFDFNGVMFDFGQASAFLSVKKACETILCLATAGLNAFMLYVEDCMEVEGEKYFGYMRPKYTYDELREIDNFAYALGVEVIPCIQTLSHLPCLMRWDRYKSMSDDDRTLLVGDERTYALVEKIITSAMKPLRTNKVHIGLDEAWGLGQGNYIRRFGYTPKNEIFQHHMEKLHEIIDRLGYYAFMWDDMYFRAASPDNSYHPPIDVEPDLEASGLIPYKDMGFVYWDYYHNYDFVYANAKKHLKCFGDVFYAGASANSYGLGYMKEFTERNNNDALRACKDTGVRKVFCTIWGDDCRESTPYSVLPGAFIYSEHGYSENPDKAQVEEMFNFAMQAELCDFDAISEIDTIPGYSDENANIERYSPSRHMLYQDVMLGMFDKNYENIDSDSHYSAFAKKMQQAADKGNAFSDMFKVYACLGRFLSVKGSLGNKLIRAYRSGNKAELKRLSDEVIPEAIRLCDEYMDSYREFFYANYKPVGFEVFDIRVGGVAARLKTAKARVDNYLGGKVEKLEELELERLLYNGAQKNGSVIYTAVSTAAKL